MNELIAVQVDKSVKEIARRMRLDQWEAIYGQDALPLLDPQGWGQGIDEELHKEIPVID